MLDNELKNKINSLWEIFWTGGITNPLDVVEQMTYLMFIHDLDAADNQRAKESAMLGLPHKSIFAGNITIGERSIPGEQLKWSVLHDFPADRMYSVMQEWVFPFIKNLHLRISAFQAVHRRCERPVPHAAAYHPHDGGDDGPPAGGGHLRPCLRHRRLFGGSRVLPEKQV